MTLPEMCALARRFSIPRLELRVIEDRLDLPAFLEERYGSPEAVRRLLAEEGMAIAAFDSSASLIGCKSAAREELIAYAEWSEALGVPAIRVFDGGETRRELPPAHLREAVDFLRWWEDLSARQGWTVKLIVETHDALCHASATRQLADTFEGPLHLLWDAHHTWRKGGEIPEESWKVLHPFVRHIHVRDSVDQPSRHAPFTYTLPGKGQIAFDSLLGLLRAARFSGTVSLEWERKWVPELVPLAEVLEALQPFRHE